MDRVLSIIIPVYQASKSLVKCVDSCLAQKAVLKGEMEIILVDDGSTDGSGELCDEIAHSNDNACVRVKHTKNHGVSHARNIGLEMAEGRFICFVDSDDVVSESFFDTMSKYLDENTTLVDETDSFVAGHKISGYQYIENSILNKNTHVWGKLFDRKTIADNHISFKEGLTIGEDLLFMLDFALSQGKEHTIRCIAEGDYTYEENEEGAMNTAFKESYLDQLVCWREAEEKLIAARGFISPYAMVSVAVSQIMTALLVVGKLAMQPESQRDKMTEELVIDRVKEQISHALTTKGAFAGLSVGYQIKVTVFRLSPKLYIKLYGNYKKRK